jgi:hypothetical protein
MADKSDPLRKEERHQPHPSEVLLDAAHDPDSFCMVLERWLDMQGERHAARGRFFACFANQRSYTIDRLIAAANMFDILPGTAVAADVQLSLQEKNARDAARKSFLALPQSAERDAVLGALGRMGKSSLKRKIRHRVDLVIDKCEWNFPELANVCEEAVNCRNYYVHGTDPVFDYSMNPAARHFFTDSLEFVFATSDLLDAGWNTSAWIARGFVMAHPFGRFCVNYLSSLKELKALLGPGRPAPNG